MPTKKDFAGKTKTSKTYDQDWQFVKLPAKGPNDSHGAWVTNRQARQMHEEALHNRWAGANEAAAGGVAPVPGSSTVPILPGSVPPATSPSPVPTTGAPTTPGWWINAAYSNPDENQAFANAANSILPFLSPEDQRTLGKYLATNYAPVYGGYESASFAPIPTTIDESTRNSYLGVPRAQQALDLLDRMQKASGGGTTGTGYEFLKNAVRLITQYSGTGPMTHEQYGQFTNAVNAFNQQANAEQKAYANLAQLFNLPTFTAGPLVQTGPNTRLY